MCVIPCSPWTKTIAQSKNWSKAVIKSKERGGGGGGNGQLTACVGGRQEDIFIAGLVERRQPRIKWDGNHRQPSWAVLHYKEIIGVWRRNWQPTIAVTGVEWGEDSC